MNTLPRGAMARVPLLSVMILLTSCSEYSQPPAQSESGVVLLSVTPLIGRPGDEVRFIGEKFPIGSTVVYFNGIRCEPEVVREETVYARVPWEVRSGPVALVTPTDSIVGPQFTVVTPCADSMCIVSYSGRLINRSSSLHYDPFYAWRDSIPWQARKEGDFVECSQAYPMGDDSYYTLTIRFYAPAFTGFPRSAQGIFQHREIGGTFTETLRGFVAIQDWNPSGVISGRISFVRPNRLDIWYDYDFWYHFI